MHPSSETQLLFVHALNRVQHLLETRHCSRSYGYSSGQNKSPPTWICWLGMAEPPNKLFGILICSVVTCILTSAATLFAVTPSPFLSGWTCFLAPVFTAFTWMVILSVAGELAVCPVAFQVLKGFCFFFLLQCWAGPGPGTWNMSAVPLSTPRRLLCFESEHPRLLTNIKHSFTKTRSFHNKLTFKKATCIFCTYRILSEKVC